MKGKVAGKKVKFRKVADCVVHIKATFNNTKVSVSDLNGNVLTSSSSGAVGYKGAKKSTPYAASLASAQACKAAVERHGMERVCIMVDGHGNGRDMAIKGVRSTVGISIKKLVDATKLPHNGCRPKKKRRV